MSQKQRKKNYIDSSVQGALIRKIGIHWILFFISSAFMMVMLKALVGDPTLPMAQRIRIESGEFLFAGIVMLSLFPVFMLDTIRFSNRFVGPIGRLRKGLRELGSGKPVRCQFRDDDFWREIASEFNEVSDLVQRQELEIEKLKSELRSTTPAEV